ncbi:hypothetical protein BS78_08G002000 [Paspalum vaginatum]|nr:hypothetical protein BS78_08G002000 [Paspalum vaginatum]
MDLFKDALRFPFFMHGDYYLHKFICDMVDKLHSIMDAKYVVLCFLLVLIVNGDLTLAETCREFVKPHPFCFKSYCKANCWIEGKATDGNVLQSICVCYLCRN